MKTAITRKFFPRKKLGAGLHLVYCYPDVVVETVNGDIVSVTQNLKAVVE